MFVFKHTHYQLLQKVQTETLLSSQTRSIQHLFLSLRCFKHKKKPGCQISILTLLFSPQEYQIDIIFAQTWVDTRLRYNSSSSMPTLTLNRYSGFTEDVLQIHRPQQRWCSYIDNYSMLCLCFLMNCNSNILLRVVPSFLGSLYCASVFSYCEYLIWEQYPPISREEACN